MSQPPLQSGSQTPVTQMPYESPQQVQNIQRPPMHAQQPTSQAAIWSLVCSIAGFATCMLTTIPGIILGHISLSKIKKSNGSLGGKGLGIAGIAVGYSSLVFLIPALAAISSPIIIRQITKARATTAINNSKNIFIDLREYQQTTGSFPQKNPKFHNSNDYLRELFNSGISVSESQYSINGIAGAVVPDENTDGENALSRGENVFSYVLGADLYTRSPLLIAPLEKVAGQVQVDTSAFGGQVVVLYTDGSAQVYQSNLPNQIIDLSTGDVIFKNGKVLAKDNEGNYIEHEVIAPDL